MRTNRNLHPYMYTVCVAYILDTGIVPRPQREESSKQKTLEMLPST